MNTQEKTYITATGLSEKLGISRVFDSLTIKK